MIRHVVLVRFRANASADDIQGVFAELRDLKRHVRGMTRFDAGANVSPEGLSRGHGHAFVVEFDDVAARDAYLVHPAHQAAGARLVALADGGLEGLVVVDIESAG
jgi:hypothetical protein